MSVYNIKDMIGQRYGKLTVMKRTNNYKPPCGREQAKWECRCDCGGVTEATTNALKQGRKRSCGCLQKEKLISDKPYERDSIDGTRVGILNSKLNKNNKSGIKGVSWDRKTNKWEAYIYLRYKKHSLGYYVCLKDAAKSRKLAEEKLFHPIIEEYEKENANV